MYQTIEQRRIFQNNNKLIKNARVRANEKRLIIFDVMKQNVYENRFIVDENLTLTISTQLRIEFTYFRNAKTKINAFIETIDLFQFFLILTFFER